MTLLRRRLPWREPAEVAAVLARLHGEQGLIWLDGDGGELDGASPWRRTLWSSTAAAACLAILRPPTPSPGCDS